MITHSFLRASSLALVAALALVSAGCGGGGTPTTEGEGPKTPDGGGASGAVGSPAPELSAAPVGGDGPSKLADAKGKVVIVDFWATYCDPCKKSFPKYQQMVEQFGGDLVVIGVSVDDPEDASEDKLKEFAKVTGAKFAIVWDKEQQTAGKYNPPKMPTSFVIDKEGNIRHVHAGYESGEEDKIADEVKALLGK
jgi:cytochrome c biogenesis protein CcmG/thiol:disulfide interchange protein DsbE